MSARYKKFQTDYATVDTAMVAYITIMDIQISPKKLKYPWRDEQISIEEWLGDQGSCAAREAALFMAPIIEAAWQTLTLDEQAFITWDWDFVPFVMLFCFKWERSIDMPEPRFAEPAEMAMHWKRCFQEHEQIMSKRGSKK